MRRLLKGFSSTKGIAGSSVAMSVECWDNILNVIVGTFGVGGVLIVFNIGLFIGRTYGDILKRFQMKRKVLFQVSVIF